MIALFPEILNCALTGDFEKLGILARVYFAQDQAKAAKIDIKMLMENAGIQLFASDAPFYAATVAKDDRGQFEVSVIYNERMSEQDMRFTLAHCLGHVLLDIQVKVASSGQAKLGFREDQNAVDRYTKSGVDKSMPPEYLLKEQYADKFAAALLLPQSMLSRAMEKIEDLDKVSAFFGVSRSCLDQRLVDLGKISIEPANFLEAERDLKNNSTNQKQQKVPLQEKMSQSLFSQAQNLPKTQSTVNSKTNQTKIDQRLAMDELHKPSSNLNKIRDLARKIDPTV